MSDFDQRNYDFSKGMADAQYAYIEAERLVKYLEAENAKLRELCSELLRMAESNDPEWLHWPELHDELRELGVEE